MRNYARNALVMLLALMFILSITRFANAAGPLINLPPGTVNATYNYPGANSYWDITLANVPSGFDVTNAIYVGWCCDETNTINNGATLGVKLYSSYDPANPWPSPNWPKVNYILNHKQGTPAEVQNAIWHFIDNNLAPVTPAEIAMVNDANANGANFVPAPGQLLAVVLYLAGSQACFIEVIVPPAYYLTVQTVPPALVTIPGQGWYETPTPVTLNAPIIVGKYRFLYWTVDNVQQGGASTDPIIATMTANHTAIAYYMDPTVGGEWAPIQTVQIVTPWIALAFIGIAIAATGSLRLLKKRW